MVGARVLLVVAVVAMVATPALAQSGTGQDRDASECRRWVHQARERIDGFRRKIHQRWRAFLSDDPNASERRAHQEALREEIEAFHQEMREGFEEHCGDADRYDRPAIGVDDGGDDAPIPAACLERNRAWIQAARSLSREHAREWRNFTSTWRTRATELAEDGNVSVEAMRDLQEERRAAAEALQAEHEDDWEALAERFPAKAECAPPDDASDDDAHAGPCQPAGWTEALEAYAAEQREEARRFQAMQRRMFLDHAAEQNATIRRWIEARRAEYADGSAPNGSDHAEAAEAVAAELRANFADYTGQVEERVEAYVERQRGDFHELVRSLVRECVERARAGSAQAAPAPGGDRAETPAKLRRCIAQVKADHRDAFQQARRDGEAPPSDVRQAVREAMRACHAKVRSAHAEHGSGEGQERAIGSWTMSHDPANGTATLSGDHVTVTGHMPSNTMQDLCVSGTCWIATLATETAFERGKIRPGGTDRPSRAEACGPGFCLTFHDNPVGLVTVEAEEAAILLTVADGIDVAEDEDALVLTAGGTSAVIRGEDVSWDAASRLVTVEGTARFLVADGKAPLTVEEDGFQARVAQARSQGALGGEISIAVDRSTPVHEAMAYDAIDITVEADPGAGRAAVTLASDTAEACKAFTINLAEDVVGDGETVHVDYFDVDPASGRSTPVDIAPADDVADALSCEPGEGPEHLVVQGGSSTSLLVTVPHWSVHRIEVQGVPAETPHPLPTVGALTSVLVLAGVAGALLKRR